MHKKSLYAGLLALSTFSAGPAFAATLVDFTFDGPISGFANPGNDATVAPAINGLTFSPWSVRDGAVVTMQERQVLAVQVGVAHQDAERHVPEEIGCRAAPLGQHFGDGA